jgi:NADH:ubiquinone oxidoreductase subunit B-like Fe-S oxidoreductase
MVATALGVPPTPEAVHEAITTQDADIVKAKLAAADAEMNAEVEKHKADLADVQDAREKNLELVKAGSNISYAPRLFPLSS